MTTEELKTIEAGFARIAASLSLPPGKRLWNAAQVAEYFGVKPNSIYRSVLNKPNFPAPVKIDGGPTRWVAGEVIEWAESQR